MYRGLSVQHNVWCEEISKIPGDSYCMEWKDVPGSVSVMLILVIFALLLMIAIHRIAIL